MEDPLSTLRPSEDNKFIIAVGWNKRVCVWRDTRVESNPNDQYLWKELPPSIDEKAELAAAAPIKPLSSSTWAKVKAEADRKARLRARQQAQVSSSTSSKTTMAGAGLGGLDGVSAGGDAEEEGGEHQPFIGVSPTRPASGVVDGHAEDILCSAFCAPNLLATAAYDGVVLVWNLNSQCVLYKYQAGEHREKVEATRNVGVLDHVAALDAAAVVSLAFIPPPPTDLHLNSVPAIMAGGGDGVLRVWHLWDPKRDPVCVNTAIVPDTAIKVIRYCNVMSVVYVGDARGRVKMYTLTKRMLAMAGENEASRRSTTRAAAAASSHDAIATAKWDVSISLAANVAVHGSDTSIVSLAVVASKRKRYDNLLATGATDSRVRLWHVAFSDGGTPVALRYIGTFGQAQSWKLSQMQATPPHDVLKAEQHYVRLTSAEAAKSGTTTQTTRAIVKARVFARTMANRAKAKSGYRMPSISIPSVEHLLVRTRAEGVDERSVYRAIPIDGDLDDNKADGDGRGKGGGSGRGSGRRRGGRRRGMSLLERRARNGRRALEAKRGKRKGGEEDGTYRWLEFESDGPEAKLLAQDEVRSRKADLFRVSSVRPLYTTVLDSMESGLTGVYDVEQEVESRMDTLTSVASKAEDGSESGIPSASSLVPLMGVVGFDLGNDFGGQHHAVLKAALDGEGGDVRIVSYAPPSSIAITNKPARRRGGVVCEFEPM